MSYKRWFGSGKPLLLLKYYCGSFYNPNSPKPEENVDFFIDDVEGEEAEGVVLLHLAARPELVERAFRHSRKYVDLKIMKF